MNTPTLEDVRDWINNHHGQEIDFTGRFGPQSPDLVSKYVADLFNGPYAVGHGRDKAYAVAEACDWEALSPEHFEAEFGDIYSADWEPYGDCGIVLADLKAYNKLLVFRQTPGPAEIGLIYRERVTCFAHPPISK